MLWLYIHFPQLQLDNLFSDQEIPVAIVCHKHHRVLQCNEQALNTGIRKGMGLASAATLCPQLQVHSYVPTIEEDKLKDIAQWLYLITSDITLFSPQGIALSVSNMLSLYGGFEQYWQHLKLHLTKLNLTFQFATGYSYQQAQILAQSGYNQALTDKEALKKALQRHTIESLNIEPTTKEKLKRVGINTIEMLLAIPLPELARKFDIQLVNYIGQLTGRFKSTLSLYCPPEHFKRHLELLYDIETIQWVEKPLGRLFTELEQFLTLRNLVAYELIVTLHQRDHSPLDVHLTSGAGADRQHQWAQLSRLTFETVTADAPIFALTLSVVRQGNFTGECDDIFDGPKGCTSRLELISTLQAKLGEGAIQALSLTNDPRPENSFMQISPLDSQSINNKPANNRSINHITTPATVPSEKRFRPTLLLPKPQLLTEASTLVLGPERIVTGWWDGHSIMRDYFIAHNEQGQWLWIFRTPDNQWFLHGLFS